MNDESAALIRLALSRERLRQALSETALPQLGHALGAAARIGQAALRPVAQRHPLGLVLGAALAGGLLACSRPWRWSLEPAIAAAWLPPLLMWTLAQVPAHPNPSAAAPAAAGPAQD